MVLPELRKVRERIRMQVPVTFHDVMVHHENSIFSPGSSLKWIMFLSCALCRERFPVQLELRFDSLGK